MYTFIGLYRSKISSINDLTQVMAKYTNTLYHIERGDIMKKTVLISGANRGLGLETAKQLALKGFKVFLGCRNIENAMASAKAVMNKELDVEIVELDVTKIKQIKDLASRFKKENIHLDILINNAGVFLESDGPLDTSRSSVLDVDPIIILKTIETNTMGALNLVQVFAPTMKERKSGRIINVSSGMAQLKGMQGHFPGYRMSKVSLNALTRMLASELSEFGIYTNSVCPGWVRTDMGGPEANLSVSEGVQTIVWLAECDQSPQGQFLRDKKPLDW